MGFHRLVTTTTIRFQLFFVAKKGWIKKMQFANDPQSRARGVARSLVRMGRKKNGKSKPHARASVAAATTSASAIPRETTEKDAGDSSPTIHPRARDDDGVDDAAVAAREPSNESPRARASVDGGVARGESEASAGETEASTPPIKLCVTVRPEYVLDDDEGTMIVATLEAVVEDLKLELDGYRSAARELAVEIEAKDRALEASAREVARELNEGRAEAIREATSRLADRLDKAERAVERERGDADRGRKACEKLRLLEAELERRMVDMDSNFEEKWAQRVREANANAEAFKNKLARLEQEMVDVKMSEEGARDELKRAKTEIETLTRRCEELATRVPRDDDDGDGHSGGEPASKPRRGFFSFITGVPSEEYAGPKRPILDASQ